MKQRRITFLIVSIVVMAIAGTGVYVFSPGFSAKDKPGAIEAYIAPRLRLLAIPRHSHHLANPVKAGPEVLARATEHFADHCASCHGNDGKGGTLIGRGLYPKPPDMTQRATQQLTDGEMYYIIENGVRFTGMPGFSEETGSDQDLESWDLVHFIRHLPHMTDEELAEMKKMNPKSRAELAREESIRRFFQGDDSQPVQSSHEHHH